MIEIKFAKADYIHFLHQFAVCLKTPIKHHTLQIPLGFGNGWMWAENLPCGISVLAFDVTLTKNVTVKRETIENEFFHLQFDEFFVSTKNINGTKTETLTKSLIKLTETFNKETFVFPADVRVKSLQFFFNKQQLSNLVDSYSIEKICGKYLFNQLHKENNGIIDMQYRSVIDQILVPSVNEPLKQNFIQNRIMLLLETFVKKSETAKVIPLKAKINENDLERLVIAESLLVKDYGTPPPTIKNLSRICAMSATKLKNDFKSIYGLPIYEYYQKNRLSKAKTLLQEGLYTCKEVGLQIGYSNLSHFASAFKKEFGISPSELLSKRGSILYAV